MPYASSSNAYKASRIFYKKHIQNKSDQNKNKLDSKNKLDRDNLSETKFVGISLVIQ